ncbi:MAG: hypothetical protein ACRERX_21135 [Pseudomonas sp.]
MACLLIVGCNPTTPGSSAADSGKRCVPEGKTIDAAQVGEQARSALTSAPGAPQVRVDSLIAREEGYLVKLLAADPSKAIGGGGLVWIDGETGCAVVLARYE